MVTRELRVGNWVQLNSKGKALPDLRSAKYYQITRIGKSFACIEDIHTNDVESLSLVDPIPLTEELLLKSGFGKKIFEGDNDLFEFTKGLFDLYSVIGCDEYFFHVNADLAPCVQYLHQLQNLYFALSGEELEVSL